jgi:magnesium chelatase family protein
VGELSLDGSLRGVRGALPIAIEARRTKVKRLIVPEVNAREAAMVGGVEVYPVKSLLEVIRYINSGNGASRLQIDTDQLLSQAQQFHVDIALAITVGTVLSAPNHAAHRFDQLL